MKQQLSRNQKYYGIDTGMRNAVAFRLPDDSGMLLENLAWTELRRQEKTVYAWTGKRECDFLVVDPGPVKTAIQDCFHLTYEIRLREVDGLSEVMERFPGCTGIILTEQQEEVLPIKDLQVFPGTGHSGITAILYLLPLVSMMNGRFHHDVLPDYLFQLPGGC
jgi:predicted AAA+ superfamily ATPase